MKRFCTRDPIVESGSEHSFEDDEEWNNNQKNTDRNTENSGHQRPNAKIGKTKLNDAIANVSSEGDYLEEIGANSPDFDPREYLRINTKSKRSNHPIWNIFGILQKKNDGKTIAKAKDRIFCRTCFEENSKLKRYV